MRGAVRAGNRPRDGHSPKRAPDETASRQRGHRDGVSKHRARAERRARVAGARARRRGSRVLPGGANCDALHVQHVDVEARLDVRARQRLVWTHARHQLPARVPERLRARRERARRGEKRAARRRNRGGGARVKEPPRSEPRRFAQKNHKLPKADIRIARELERELREGRRQGGREPGGGEPFRRKKRQAAARARGARWPRRRA
mmetsp:Transcript_381/g.1439  ORF Transcript_381/g.1439 Transcript_381/m.1439 type:complete len:204 (+) Transcript_381:759-1370(+)